jgi:hypothetical protein
VVDLAHEPAKLLRADSPDARSEEFVVIITEMFCSFYLT